MRQLTWLIGAVALVAACGDNLGGAEAPDAGVAVDAGADGPPAPVGCEEGAACDDGDLCTLGDRCRAGVCQPGPRVEGPMRLLGRLDNAHGVPVALGAGRFVSLTDVLIRTRVRLLERRPLGIAALDSEIVSTYFTFEDEVRAYPLGDRLVALASSDHRDLTLVGVDGDDLVRRGALTQLDWQIGYVGGQGDRVWLCAGQFGVGYAAVAIDIRDPDAPVEVGAMPLPRCGPIATSADGQRVFVATVDGVRWIDAAPLDAGGAPVLHDVFAPAAGVAVSGAYLLLMNADAVRILRTADLTEVVTVAVAGVEAAALAGDRLIVEGARATAAGAERFVGLYDALGAGGPTRLDDRVLSTWTGAYRYPTGPWYPVATDGTTVITRYSDRLFDLSRGRLDEIRAPELAPTAILARGRGGVYAYGDAAAAIIDVDDVAAPAFRAGGAFEDVRRWAPVLDDSLGPPRFVVGASDLYDPSWVIGNAAGPLAIDRWTLDEDGRRELRGSATLLLRGYTELTAEGQRLYGLAHARDPSVTLESWSLAAVQAAGTEPLAPDLEATLPNDSGTLVGFDVDGEVGVAVVSTAVKDAEGTLHPMLTWLDVTVAPPAVVSQVPAAATFLNVVVRGDRVVASSGGHVYFYQRDVGEVASVDVEAFVEHFLSFDGDRAYYAATLVAPGVLRNQLVAHRFGSVTQEAAIDLDATARSLFEVDGGLVAGTAAGLVTLHPSCPGP